MPAPRASTGPAPQWLEARIAGEGITVRWLPPMATDLNPSKQIQGLVIEKNTIKSQGNHVGWCYNML